MTYTLWSHGELLGESELDYVRVFSHLRTGDLHVTQRGMVAFERLSQTHADSFYGMRRVNGERERGTVDPSDEKTLLADLAAEQDQYEALALELRAPNGSVIATESIHVTDTDYLLAIAREQDQEDELSAGLGPEDALVAEDLAALKEQLEELLEDHPPWAQSGPQREPARFQISVTLKDEWAIP